MKIKAKKTLKAEKIYIDDDLMYEERNIQREISMYAMKQRKQGKRVGIWYQRIYIDNKLLIWEKGKGLVKKQLFQAHK